MSQASPLLSMQDSFSIEDTSEPEFAVACPACKKYGHVTDCISQDLRPVLYLDLAATLFNPGQTILYKSYVCSEKQLLWHTSMISKNPKFIHQIIKNLIKYIFEHTPQEYREDIRMLLSIKGLHVPRELKFICDIIENLQKNRFDDPLVDLLLQFNGDRPSQTFEIYLKDARFLRLLPLFSIMFLGKRADGKGLCISQVRAPLCPSQDISFNVSLLQTPAPQTQPEPLESENEDGSFSCLSLSQHLKSEASSHSLSSLFSHSSSHQSDDTVLGSDSLNPLYICDDDELDLPAVVDKPVIIRHESDIKSEHTYS